MSQVMTSSARSVGPMAVGPGAVPPARYFHALGLAESATELEVILGYRGLSAASRRAAATAYGVLRSHFRRTARRLAESNRDDVMDGATTQRCLRRLRVAWVPGSDDGLDEALTAIEASLSGEPDAERLVGDARLAVLRLHAERVAAEALRGPRLRVRAAGGDEREHPQVVHYLEILGLSGGVGFSDLHAAHRERSRELDADREASEDERERCRREIDHAFDVTRQVLTKRERALRARSARRRRSGSPASGSLLARASRLAAVPLAFALVVMVQDDIRVAVTQYEVGEQLTVREDGRAFGEVVGHDPAHVFDGASEPVSAYRVRDASTGREQWVAEWFAESALRAS